MERDGAQLGWNFTEADPTAAADAHTAWALLRCVRGLPGALPSHNHDDLGSWIAPAVATFPAELVAALSGHDDPECREALAQDTDVHALLGQHAVLLALGRGAAKGLPHFRGLLDALEQRLLDFVARHPQRYTRNVQLLAELLGLPAAEAEFLRLAAALSQGTLARANFTFVDTPARIARAMTLISGARGLALARMFESNSPLGQAGLLADMRASRPVRDLDDLLALSAVGEGLLSGCFDSTEDMAAAVLRSFDTPALGQRLAWPHLQQAQALLVATLRAAVARGERGVNILVHGEAGTGKTEFVRHLVAEAGVTAFAVDHLDGHGGEARREDRLASLRLCQTFAGRHERAVLVLDEAEDVFRDEYGSPLAGLLGRRSEGKAWMNQLLECNRQPVVWISNRVSHLDPAYLRRFTFCLEVPRPPLALRREITQARLQPLGCRPETVEAVADSALMTPAPQRALPCSAPAAGWGPMPPCTRWCRGTARPAVTRSRSAVPRRPSPSTRATSTSPGRCVPRNSWRCCAAKGRAPCCSPARRALARRSSPPRSRARSDAAWWCARLPTSTPSGTASPRVTSRACSGSATRARNCCSWTRPTCCWARAAAAHTGPTGP